MVAAARQGPQALNGGGHAAARNAVIAAYLGWTLDAFDFFVMVFVFQDVARSFGASFTTVTFAVTLTLGMRALGAVLFGRAADRFGRRPALMASILAYSALECASGFAPSLTVFLVLRALFGIAMGGEWGIGAALAMETVPPQWRGRVSGLLQSGYPTGYLIATLLYAAAYPSLGWRGLFMLGAAPALLVLFIRARVPESASRRRGGGAPRASGGTLRHQARLAAYAIVLMTAFNLFSHGSQDLYPAFLQGQLHFPHQAVAAIAIAYTLAAIAGGIVFGTLSERIGRPQAIALAALLVLPAIPLWVFSTAPVAAAAGAVVVQLGVQGAWGVVPAHLNELSPPDLRGTFPGVVYQAGNFIACATATLQSTLAAALGHDLRWPLAGTVGIVALLLTVLALCGPRPDRGQALQSA